MTGLIWEESFGVFFFVTCIVAGGIAFMTGRGIAMTWRPKLQMAAYALLLAAVCRFLHFALFEGTLLSLQFYVMDLIVIFLMTQLGYTMTRTNQMARQYSWSYKKTSALSASRKS